MKNEEKMTPIKVIKGIGALALQYFLYIILPGIGILLLLLGISWIKTQNNKPKISEPLTFTIAKRYEGEKLYTLCEQQASNYPSIVVHYANNSKTLSTDCNGIQFYHTEYIDAYVYDVHLDDDNYIIFEAKAKEL